ncbi:MAG: hypothetical protein J3K34DRAFT_524925 [Monoraphidium minutum]|nr:MAG: hypothetical protein J3K34DRAFT_524925 [Monoraphidium minutum]
MRVGAPGPSWCSTSRPNGEQQRAAVMLRPPSLARGSCGEAQANPRAEDEGDEEAEAPIARSRGPLQLRPPLPPTAHPAPLAPTAPYYARKIDALAAALGARRAHVASLVRQQPALAAPPADALAGRVLRLADALCVPPVQALVMAARNPAAAAANPADLRRKAERLGAALGLPAEQAMFLAARQPALLEYAPEAVASDCARLGASLGASPRGVLQLLSRVGGRELRFLLGASGGMLREQLIDVLESLGLPADATRDLDTLRMVAKCPGLLCAPPGAVAESCEALVAVFQAAPAAFVHVLNRCPSLLTYDADEILGNYRGLGRLLGLPPPVLGRLLAAQPRLLRCRPGDVQAKLEALIYDMYLPREQAKLEALIYDMYLPREQVLDLVMRQPTLLLFGADTLRAKLEGLQQLLGGAGYQVAVALLAKQPSLAGYQPEALAAKHAALCAAAGLEPAKANAAVLRFPLLLSLSTAQVEATCELLLTRLALPSRASLGELLARHPELLIYGAPTLQDALDDLQVFVGLEPHEAAAVLRRAPRVLRAPAGVWRDNLRCLVAELGASPEQARAAVLAHPRLLRLEPSALARHCGRMRRLLDAAPAWGARLRELEGRRVAGLLRYNADHWSRLEYLVESGQSEAFDFGSPLLLRTHAFSRHFPKWPAWAAARRRAAEARRRKGAPRRGGGGGGGGGAEAGLEPDGGGGGALQRDQRREAQQRQEQDQPQQEGQPGPNGGAFARQQQQEQRQRLFEEEWQQEQQQPPPPADGDGRRPPKRRQRQPSADAAGEEGGGGARSLQERQAGQQQQQEREQQRQERERQQQAQPPPLDEPGLASAAALTGDGAPPAAGAAPRPPEGERAPELLAAGQPRRGVHE